MDEQCPETGQWFYHVLYDPVGEIFLLRIAAHVLERQYRPGMVCRVRLELGWARSAAFSTRGRKMLQFILDRHVRIGLGNIFEALRAHVFKGDITVPRKCHLKCKSRPAPAMPSRRAANIDPVTKDIVHFDNNIAHVPMRNSMRLSYNILYFCSSMPRWISPANIS